VFFRDLTICILDTLEVRLSGLTDLVQEMWM
jgi:hypothetical protein